MRPNSPQVNNTTTGVANINSTTPREYSLFDKLNTMSRVKRRKQEADNLVAEARQAMEDPLHPIAQNNVPVGYQLAEGEEFSMIEPYSKDQPQLKELLEILIDWINQELIDERILVRNIEEDLYDGQVLQKLLEKLTKASLNQPELTQTEMGQRQRLKLVLEEINAILGLSEAYSNVKWSASAIFNKDLVATLRLLVAIVHEFSPALRIPSDVHITVLIVRKINGVLQHRRQVEMITEIKDTQDFTSGRDAISALVDCAVPEKLTTFQEILLKFVNYHLNKLNLVVNDLDKQMDDGVFFLLLMGLLNGFYIPLYAYYLAPANNEQKQTNFELVFQILEETDNNCAGIHIDDLVHNDLKTILRLLYVLYTRYKDVQ